MNRNIEIHIGEMILHGFASHDRETIRAAVETELTRLIAEQGIPAALSSAGKYARIDAGEFTVAKDARTVSVGSSIAASVYQGVKNGNDKK